MYPLISIIIPSYNKVKYIEKTLRSIVTQKNVRVEVIIQDGGSTDGTLDIIKKYAKKYPKLIKFVSKKDDGQLDAINKGLKKAKGEIVTFINADDVYEKDALFTVAEYYKENPNALWFAGKGIVIDENDIEIAKIATVYKSFLLKFNLYNLLLMTNYLMQPSVFLTKKALRKYGLFTGTKFAVMEYDMWLKIGKDQMPVVIDMYLSKFRISEGSISSVMYNELFSMDIKIVRKHSKNVIFVYTHKINNYFRILYLKTL
ncbi:MAG: glycosyltransferase family 2 protein [bacterium]|nr:MAG: glycosyltransferase family 2 protein [bacterium]